MPDAIKPATPPGEPPSAFQTLPTHVRWKTDIVAPPNAPYFQLNDILSINIIGNVAGIAPTFSYRVLTPEGQITQGNAILNPTVLGSGSTTFVPILEGWLLSASFQILSGVVPNMLVYAVVQFARDILPNNPRYGVLWEGYINGGQSRGLPSSPPQAITDGAGVIRSVTGTTPAAGAEINEVVPSNRRWNLLAFTSVLTASATVANRLPTFLLDDGANALYQSPPPVAQVAGAVIRYVADRIYFTFPAGTNPQILSLPTPIAMKATYRIRTSTAGLQAGDQWSAPQYLIQEWDTWDA